MTFLSVNVGDIVRLRKPHPCGGYEWAVVRTGADIGLVCQTCKRRLLLPRDEFRKAVKTFVQRAPESPPPPAPAAPADSA